MLSFFCLLSSVAILFFVLRYRVHVHVTYTSRVPERRAEARARCGAPTATTRSGNFPSRPSPAGGRPAGELARKF